MEGLFQGKLQVRSILIFGDPGNGKTAIGTIISIDGYDRIYSNVDIYLHGKQLNEKISGMEDIQKIPFDGYKKGLIIIDEMGVNGNARRSMSEENLQFGELDALKRKKNCDVVWIAQLDRMFDIYQRELADLVIRMEMIRDDLFYIQKMKPDPINPKRLNYDVTFELDIFECHRQMGLSYNQLENSKLEKVKKSKKGS